MHSAISLHSFLKEDKWKLENIQKLLERYFYFINDEDIRGQTLLHFVLMSKNCSAEIVKLLLKYGADVNGGNAVNSSLCTALTFRVSKDVIRLLLDAGGSLNACKNKMHGSVLHCATYFPMKSLKADVLKLLIERGADVNAVNSQGQNVLCCALQYGYGDSITIQLLLEAGVSLNGCRNHASPLLCATSVFGGHRELRPKVVKLLLKAGVCPHQVDENGFTALQWALHNCSYIDTKAIELLLDCHKGTDLNTLLDKNNNSLLHFAILNTDRELSAVKLLIRKGVKADRVNSEGDTLLNKAIKNEYFQKSLIKVLLKNGAKVDVESVRLAIEKFRCVTTFKLLLAASAPISKTSFHFLLKMLLNQLVDNSDRRMACFQFLVKVYFLQVSNYCMSFLNFRHKYFQNVLDFRDECVPELLKMKSKNIGRGLTLCDFLSGCSSPYKTAADRDAEEKIYDFDRLLEVIANDEFPLYFEYISIKIGMPRMTEKLQKVQLYAPKYSANDECVENITLTYECVLRIADYLKEEDVLRFISASFNVDGSISNVQADPVKGKAIHNS